MASSLGVSLNGLVALALRDYLDNRTRRRMPSSGAPLVVAGAASGPSGPTAPSAPRAEATTYRAPASRSDPCPCGAKTREGYPVKWKHCHGARLAS